MSKKSVDGTVVFNEYFTSVYGDRWTGIHDALLKDDKKVARRNLFFRQEQAQASAEEGIGAPHEFLPHCFEINESFDLGLFDTPMLPYYRMDPASIIAAQSLAVQPGDAVLDMCAAPGGKSLVLLESLTAAQEGECLDLSGRFVANEMSAKRKFRMMSVFKRYLPKEVRSIVKIRGVDGSIIGLNKKQDFDRILLDAPCSGERGVVHKKSELQTWKVKRTKSFGIRQYSLLSSAFMALKPGGRIVYSTCSISPHENDEVIRKLIKRKKNEIDILELDPIGPSEKTEFGQQFLPDRDGWGPIYYSVIQKGE